MFCPKCGTEVADDATFCHSCGAAAAATPPQQSQAPSPPQPAQPQAAAYQQPVAAPVQPPGVAGFQCGRCGRPAMPDRLFCTYCTGFLAAPDAGNKGGLFQRWLATLVDAAVGWIALIVIILVAVAIGGEAGVVVWLLLTAAQLVVWIVLLNQGTTVGKMMFGLKVVRTDGSNPGFGTMLLREWMGKTISYLFFGLGFWWALLDKDRQTWHDKFAGTVVVTR